MIHAHQPIWLPSHVTVEKRYRGESAGLTAVFIRFDHYWSFSKKIEYITMKSSFMKLNITENKKVFLNLTKYFELTSVFQGGVIF